MVLRIRVLLPEQSVRQFGEISPRPPVGSRRVAGELRGLGFALACPLPGGGAGAERRPWTEMGDVGKRRYAYDIYCGVLESQPYIVGRRYFPIAPLVSCRFDAFIEGMHYEEFYLGNPK